MTAHELLRSQFNDAHNQLSKVLSGFPESAMDHLPATFFHTPRATVLHLTEAYLAVVASLNGETYEWGSYAPEDLSTDAVVAEFNQRRAAAVEAVLAGGDEHLMEGYSYILGHDLYHVGQLVLARLAAEPEWDMLTIYS